MLNVLQNTQTLLTKESIKAARLHFAGNCLACIQGMKNGDFYVNDLSAYVISERKVIRAVYRNPN